MIAKQHDDSAIAAGSRKKSSEISLFILILDSFSAVRYALTIYLLYKAVDRNTKLCSSE